MWLIPECKQTQSLRSVQHKAILSPEIKMQLHSCFKLILKQWDTEKIMKTTIIFHVKTFAEGII